MWNENIRIRKIPKKCSNYAHMFQEAAADLTEVRLLLVEPLLQAFEELPLEAVDVLDVAENGA